MSGNPPAQPASFSQAVDSRIATANASATSSSQPSNSLHPFPRPSLFGFAGPSPSGQTKSTAASASFGPPFGNMNGDRTGTSSTPARPSTSTGSALWGGVNSAWSPANVPKSQPTFGSTRCSSASTEPSTNFSAPMKTSNTATSAPTDPSKSQPMTGGMQMWRESTEPATTPSDPSTDAALGQVHSEEGLFPPAKPTCKLPPSTASISMAPARSASPFAAYGCGRTAASGSNLGAQTQAQYQSNAVSTTTKDNSYIRLPLELLRGPGVEIAVGSKSLVGSEEDAYETWSLAKALVSRHSILLKEACLRPQHDDRDIRVALPEDDPKLFELFVEWMYYGSYTLPPHNPFVGGVTPSPNAQAWVLGDRLRSVAFKNYAMARLHGSAGNIPIKPADVKYACKYSAAGSKLRKVLFDYVAKHFSNRFRIEGTTEQWDEIIAEHGDARSFLLRSFRMGTNDQGTSQGKSKEYMEDEEGEENEAHLRSKDERSVVLGKRDADGTLVKREPTDS